jgi:hypothetical protein
MAAAVALPAAGAPPARRAAGPEVYAAVKSLRAPAPHAEFAVDNTGEGGHTYTKPTNIGLDLLSTLAAVGAGHESAEEARRHVEAVLTGVESLRRYRGLFPEYVKLEGGKVFAEVSREGRIRYSAVDSAWLHFALGVAAAHYRATDPALAARMTALVDAADYGAFLHGEPPRMGHGFEVTADRDEVAVRWPYDYDNINSEARVTNLFLAAAGKVPEAVWDGMFYRWTDGPAGPLAEGWHKSAFVELTGNIFFDESALAPRSLGVSHRNYLAACRQVAKGRKLRLYGWAPCFGPDDQYREYGLDAPEIATPYAAALLTTWDDPRAWENLEKMLQFLTPSDPPKPYPDALDSKTGQVVSRRSLSLDQNLFYLAVHKDIVRRLTAAADWYPAAERLLKRLDETHAAPSR